MSLEKTIRELEEKVAIKVLQDGSLNYLVVKFA